MFGSEGVHLLRLLELYEVEWQGHISNLRPGPLGDLLLFMKQNTLSLKDLNG